MRWWVCSCCCRYCCRNSGLIQVELLRLCGQREGIGLMLAATRKMRQRGGRKRRGQEGQREGERRRCRLRALSHSARGLWPCAGRRAQSRSYQGCC
jgi:hypothetical protein